MRYHGTSTRRPLSAALSAGDTLRVRPWKLGARVLPRDGPPRTSLDSATHLGTAHPLDAVTTCATCEPVTTALDPEACAHRVTSQRDRHEARRRVRAATDGSRRVRSDGYPVAHDRLRDRQAAAQAMREHGHQCSRSRSRDSIVLPGGFNPPTVLPAGTPTSLSVRLEAPTPHLARPPPAASRPRQSPNFVS